MILRCSPLARRILGLVAAVDPTTRWRFVLAATALIGMLAGVSANAQTRPASPSVVHEVWAFKDGAPESPTALAQTADGYLWIGAADGLFRFDGTRFELFGTPAGDALQSNYVSALGAADGGLWIGYWFGGFSFLQHGRLRNFVHTTGTVTGFAQDRGGAVWAGAQSRPGTSGLWRYDGSSWQVVGDGWRFPGQSVVQLGVDAKGNLWVLTGRRGAETPKDLYVLPANERAFRNAGKSLLVKGFTWDADHQVVTSPDARAPDGGAFVAWDSTPPPYPILRKRSFQIVDRADGAWLFTLDAGVLRHAVGDPLHDVIENSGPQDSEVHDVDASHAAALVDREGSLWMGGAKGIERLSYSPLTRQTLPASSLGLFMIAADREGAMWISAADGEGKSVIYRVRDGTVDWERSVPGVSSFAYRAPDGTHWFAGESGLWHRVGDDLSRVDLPPEWAGMSRFLVTMTHDGSGGYWLFVSGVGIYRLRDGTWTKYRPAPSLPEREASLQCPGSGPLVMFTDPANRVWFGCTKGQVAVIDHDQETVFGAKEGVLPGNVTAIYARGSAVWIGSEFGLQQYDGVRFRSVRSLDPQALRGISGIVETADGDLWLNGLGGIVHVRRAELAQALQDPLHRVSSERFDRRSGLPGLPSQLRRTPTAIEGTDGKLWFSVGGGVVSVDPRRRSLGATAPPASIQSVVADNERYDVDQALNFPAGTSNLQIGYAAVSLLHPEAIRFRYRLEGLDGDWRDAGTSTSVTYRSVPPGAYRFEVEASDPNGIWSGTTASARFTIQPAYYQTTWFRASFVVLLAALAWAVYRWRIAWLQRRFEMTLDTRVAERTRIARELHDTLLQSFHALLLHLQTVFVLLPSRAPEAKAKLGDVIEQAAAAIGEGRDAVQALRDSTVQRNDLALAIGLLGEQLSQDASGRAPAKLGMTVHGDIRELHPLVRDEIYRIAAEALRNAFAHAQAHRIDVDVRYERDRFELSVRDDGTGIDAAILSEGVEGHFGLRGMQERAKVIGGTLSIESEPGAGTQVRLTVPASRAYARRPRWSRRRAPETA
ncbi:MAG TPA: triple tyrosine motif-containing protein [Caldimonas sp.]|nr:triple tyrosine motif-containing protein [Caldimonas sp.]